MSKWTIETQPSTSDLLIIPCFEQSPLEIGKTLVDDHVQNLIIAAEKRKDFEGEKQQTALLYTTSESLPRVLLLGLGEKKKLTMRSLKHAIGSAVVLAQGKKMKRLHIVISSQLLKQFDEKILFQELVVAVETAAYSFDEHKDEAAKVDAIENVSVIGDFDSKQKKAALNAISRGEKIAQAMNVVRRLGNTPPSVMNPSYLAKEIQSLVKKLPTVRVKILSRPQIQTLGMGCFLGVAKGSVEEPKFIILEYFAGKKNEKPSVLVGKGITFDSGGLSLKPDPYMSDMKFDMLGAATAFGSIYAAALLGIKKNIVALLPACENMPSGTAYRPDDILTAMNGTTVHIDNTDAEGRLILADALCYAARYTPKEVIDFATLTGACMVALGNERSGLFTNEERMAEALVSSAETAGEQLWRLPLGEEYREAMKSEVADLKNLGGVGNPRFAGASTAAAFLEFFTQDPKSGDALYPWAHIDLSCSYYGGKGKPWIRGGANGFGVQTMIAYLT